MALIGEMKYLTIGGNTYSIPEPELPIASSSTLGGIKVGSGLTIDSSTGVLTATGTSITIDTVMSDSSTNTVQNKVIKSYVDTNIPTKVSDLQNDSGFTTNTGTVTSVRVQASSPLSSSTSTAQSTSLNTTISFSNQNKNLVLAGPSSGSSAAAPSFRSLVAADIPDLSSIYLTSYTETDPVFSASAAANISSTDISNWNAKGSVSSVGLTNATNGGLTISGSPVTSSGSITVGHTNILTSAQTTQAVYPIKIDKNGHISAYGNAVSIPSKTSDLTNDSGFITDAGVTSFNGDTGAITYTAPVTSVNGNTGAVTVVEDDHKWGGVTLGGTGANTAANSYVPVKDSIGNTSGTASWATVTSTPTSYNIAKYDGGPYLYSTTPTSGDSSTKVATTAWVTGKGYLTSYTETDPTVPSWAKEESKPSYALNEITSADDIQAIEALTGTIGLLKKTAANTWTLDTTAYTTNTGTVTSVGAQNATNGGLTISGSPITTSGTITIGHSNVLTSAQTTQALYPIKIDKNGHISSYGTAVTSLPASDVYSWAKASTKPSYTASEVGAVAKTGDTMTGQLTASGGISTTTLTTSGSMTVGENLTVDGFVHTTNRRSALLSNIGAGWHRVLEFAPTTVEHRLGRAGIIIDFDITRFGTTNETHHVSLSLIETNAKFYGEFSNSNTQLIDKIRYIYDSSKGYVDIHLSSAYSANVAVDYQVATSAGSFRGQVTAKKLVYVVDSPSGETVMVSYDLDSNTDRTGSMTVGSGATSLSNVHIVQHGKMVNISGYAQGTFTASTTGYALGTITGVSMPSTAYLYCNGGCGSAENYTSNCAYLCITKSSGVLTARVSVNSTYITFNITYLID